MGPADGNGLVARGPLCPVECACRFWAGPTSLFLADTVRGAAESLGFTGKTGRYGLKIKGMTMMILRLGWKVDQRMEETRHGPVGGIWLVRITAAWMTRDGDFFPVRIKRRKKKRARLGCIAGPSQTTLPSANKLVLVTGNKHYQFVSLPRDRPNHHCHASRH